jgi:hypothetical protein
MRQLTCTRQPWILGAGGLGWMPRGAGVPPRRRYKEEGGLRLAAEAELAQLRAAREALAGQVRCCELAQATAVALPAVSSPPQAQTATPNSHSSPMRAPGRHVLPSSLAAVRHMAMRTLATHVIRVTAV